MIMGAITSNAAFVDYFTGGLMDRAMRLTSCAAFERVFGLDSKSDASHGIRRYHANGGSVSRVFRVASGVPATASLTVRGGSPAQETLAIRANSEEKWANRAVRVAVDGGAAVARVDGRPVVLRCEDFRDVSAPAPWPHP
jgi:hypothetical protein